MLHKILIYRYFHRALLTPFLWLTFQGQNHSRSSVQSPLILPWCPLPNPLSLSNWVRCPPSSPPNHLMPVSAVNITFLITQYVFLCLSPKDVHEGRDYYIYLHSLSILHDTWHIPNPLCIIVQNQLPHWKAKWSNSFVTRLK